jgi:hypothetical protein
MLWKKLYGVVKNLMLKKGDMIVTAAVLVAALLGLAFLAWQPRGATAGLRAEIYLDGTLVQSVALAKQQEIRLESASGYNVLQVGPQGIRMLEADCRNQDCLRSGLQTRPSGLIACLPHRLLVRLSGPKDGDFDAVAR